MRVSSSVVDVLVLQPVEPDICGQSKSPSLAGVPNQTAAAGTPDQTEQRWRVLTLRRAANVRCTGAWEIVHGSIEPDELPADAALRELREETGLTADRLYSLTVNPFYLHTTNTVQLAIGFIAIVSATADVTIGDEHDAWAWHVPSDAQSILAWPRSHDAIRQALHILRTGDAGPAEDVLRVDLLHHRRRSTTHQAALALDHL